MIGKSNILNVTIFFIDFNWNKLHYTWMFLYIPSSKYHCPQSTIHSILVCQVYNNHIVLDYRCHPTPMLVLLLFTFSTNMSSVLYHFHATTIILLRILLSIQLRTSKAKASIEFVSLCKA